VPIYLKNYIRTEEERIKLYRSIGNIKEFIKNRKISKLILKKNMENYGNCNKYNKYSVK